ncbi:MAG: hypothetical protein N2444_02060 [Methylocystis sp.]|nr:hypothetical protein [Methylocystis sp.]
MLGVGAYAACNKYDKSANHVPVQARVTDIKDMCCMEKRSCRRREYSGAIACDLAETAVRMSPKWQGVDIRQKIAVAFEFIPPVDRKPIPANANTAPAPMA